MKNEKVGLIAPATELGVSVDPVLVRLAETLGAEVLQYRSPTTLDRRADADTARCSDVYRNWELALSRDPDGLLVTLNICLYPTQINWFLPSSDSSPYRPLAEVLERLEVRELLESSPAGVVESCRAGLLNLHRGDMSGATPDWLDLPEVDDEADAHEIACSCAAEDDDGVCPAERDGQLCPEKRREELLEPLDPTARTWAEKIVSLVRDMYSEEFPTSFWSGEHPYWSTWPESWQIGTRIPLHLHVLLDDGSSWILPGLRDTNPTAGCYGHRRAAFREWHEGLGRVPKAVVVVDPQLHGPIRLPHLGTQLLTSSLEVWNGASPALNVGVWQAGEAHPETAGMVSTPLPLTYPL